MSRSFLRAILLRVDDLMSGKEVHRLLSVEVFNPVFIPFKTSLSLTKTRLSLIEFI